MRPARRNLAQLPACLLAGALLLLPTGALPRAWRLGPPAAVVAARAATSCPAGLANSLARTGAARELVVVEAPTTSSTVATVTLWRRQGPCFQPAGGPWPAQVGASGLSAHHLEGDGTTPIGAFGIGPVMYGVDADPGVAYPYHRLACGDWWDEDPASPAYNRFVHVPCGQSPPFGGDSEALWTEAPAYDAFAVLQYNVRPTVPGRGSAIFLHVDTGVPTDGCVALPAAELLATLRWLRPADHPLVVVGTAAGIRRL